MSLKKQVKEQKADKIKLEEELAVSKRTVKNTKFYEMDQEIKLYKDELIRLRYLLEQAYSPGLISSGAAMSEGAPSARPSTHALPASSFASTGALALRMRVGRVLPVGDYVLRHLREGTTQLMCTCTI